MRAFLKTTACALALATVLSGCATTSMPATQIGGVADSCQPLRKPFDKARNYVRDQAVQGAVAGAAVGLLAGVLAGGDRRDIAKTTVAGAFTGSVVAYIAARRQNATTVGELQSLIDNDFAPEMGLYSAMAVNLAALGDCRRGQLHALREDLEAGRVDKAAGAARLAEIKQAIDGDDAVISAAAQVQTRRVIYYAQAQGLAEGLKEAQVNDEAKVVSYLGGDAEVDRYRAQVTVLAEEDEPPAPVRAAPTVTTTAYAKASGARIRAQPTTQSAEVTFLKPGAVVQVVGRATADPAWSEVRHDGKTGFIRSDLLTASRQVAAPSAVPPTVVAKPAPPRKPKGPKLIRVSAPTVVAAAPKDRARQALAAHRSFTDVRKADKTAILQAYADIERLI